MIAEIYAADAKPWADALRSLGFTVGARQPHRDRVTTPAWGGGAGVLVSVPPDGVEGKYSRVREWLQRHGDGVAGVAIPTENPVAAFRDAVNAGATPAGPRYAVSLHDVEHTFTWPRENIAGPGPFTALDHVALVTADLDATRVLYEKTLGATWEPMDPIAIGGEGMDLGVARIPGLTVTVVAPSTPQGQLQDFLSLHSGPGIQHVAFGVPGILQHVTDTPRAGYLPTPGSYFDALPQRLGFTPPDLGAMRATGVLYDRDHGGELRQIFTSSPVRPVFFEIIERHDGTGFGKANIEALYEAKRRSS